MIVQSHEIHDRAMAHPTECLLISGLSIQKSPAKLFHFTYPIDQHFHFGAFWRELLPSFFTFPNFMDPDDSGYGFEFLTLGSK
jgi:hypothetical protein